MRKMFNFTGILSKGGAVSPVAVFRINQGRHLATRLSLGLSLFRGLFVGRAGSAASSTSFTASVRKEGKKAR